MGGNTNCIQQNKLGVSDAQRFLPRLLLPLRYLTWWSRLQSWKWSCNCTGYVICILIVKYKCWDILCSSEKKKESFLLVLVRFSMYVRLYKCIHWHCSCLLPFLWNRRSRNLHTAHVCLCPYAPNYVPMKFGFILHSIWFKDTLQKI